LHVDQVLGQLGGTHPSHHGRCRARPGTQTETSCHGGDVTDVRLVGDDMLVPCVDGAERPYLSFDAAASTPALPAVAARASEFLPMYSSVHRGAGYKSQAATAAYEDARAAF